MNKKFFHKKEPEQTDYSMSSIREIAQAIKSDWSDLDSNKVAHELVEAMMTLGRIEDNYHLDSGYRIVGLFLSRSRGWNSYKAKFIKKELHKRINT